MSDINTKVIRQVIIAQQEMYKTLTENLSNTLKPVRGIPLSKPINKVGGKSQDVITLLVCD